MSPKLKPFFLSLLILCAVIPATAQDSVYHKWEVKSRKNGEKFELLFNAQPAAGFYVFAPGQLLMDIPAVTVTFVDSGFRLEGIRVEGSASESKAIGVFDNAAFNVQSGQLGWTGDIQGEGPPPARLQGELVYHIGKGDDFFQQVVPFTVEVEGGRQATNSRILVPSIDIDHPLSDAGDDIKKDSSYLSIFLLGFLGGLIALFTPCVFPMIPLTVSFFTGKNGKPGKGKGSAILYGFFIFLIYMLITIPFHIAGKTNPDIFNNISTNVWLNLVFFVVFVVFAISFFGYFEITLPSSFANKADSKSGLGNIAGIFFMALTLAIVSFSCTGPILGTLLAGVADGGAWPLTAGAAGFGLALGLPFAIFALFPNWLQSIPKSGGWMTDLKVVLGFVELALAVKFLANADNVIQWGILKREVFIALWIIIGALVVLYLLGKLKFSHSTPPKKYGPVRIAFIVLFSAITLYLIPGLTNTGAARLSLISGFPPPVCYSLYSDPVNCDKPLLDYDEAVRLARQKNKPVLIDFTGWACVNCRRMEEKVWTDATVDKLMKEDFILVSLYVDERTMLPAAERQVYTAKNGSEKSIQTIGDKWTAFQVDNFGATSQPQYAIISPDEKALVKTKFYTPDPREFEAWLRAGLAAQEKSPGTAAK
ncbi:MAG: thioredoxin family protein [Chitinophagaceae bacterium]|nr:MAG: thioredoxin family protein [Chitinophagaceae bacterium]